MLGLRQAAAVSERHLWLSDLSFAEYRRRDPDEADSKPSLRTVTVTVTETRALTTPHARPRPGGCNTPAGRLWGGKCRGARRSARCTRSVEHQGAFGSRRDPKDATFLDVEHGLKLFAVIVEAVKFDALRLLARETHSKMDAATT